MPKLLTLVLFTALLLSGTLWAQETTKLTLPESADVRIIVDISGSMKQTDPNNLRQPAVRLLARVLPEGSTAGVWTFGQYVNMLVPHGEVTDSWREMAIDRSKRINSVALRTNLGKAIEVASDDYVTGGSLENTHFILLTDGKVDISDSAEVNQAEEQRILGKILEDLAARGATFHPVALSDLADAGFLKTLAEESQGSFRLADTAESLNLAFLDALTNAAPQEQIPFDGNAFIVDGGVNEFTALIFRGQSEAGEPVEPANLELIRPDGKTLLQSELSDNVRWAREAAYDLVTITEPTAGEWRVKGELGEGSRVLSADQPPASSEPEPVVESQPLPAEPIDSAPTEEQSSASEEPLDNGVPAAGKEPESALSQPMPLWIIGSAVGGFVILALIIILLMRRRRNTLVPVVMPEPDEEPAEEDIPIANAVVEPEETIPELTEPENGSKPDDEQKK